MSKRHDWVCDKSFETNQKIQFTVSVVNSYLLIDLCIMNGRNEEIAVRNIHADIFDLWFVRKRLLDHPIRFVQ